MKGCSKFPKSPELELIEIDKHISDTCLTLGILKVLQEKVVGKKSRDEEVLHFKKRKDRHMATKNPTHFYFWYYPSKIGSKCIK